jgi:tetratricopeptide (TPR) repeat protein
MREGGGSYRPGGGRSGASNASIEGARVRAAINSGDLKHAEELLDAFPSRNAEWHFLMGCLYYSKRWVHDALPFFQKAANMDPGNQEYREALWKINQGAYGYRPYGRGPAQNDGCNMCDCCTALLCMNLCCRCN